MNLRQQYANKSKSEKLIAFLTFSNLLLSRVIFIDRVSRLPLVLKVSSIMPHIGFALIAFALIHVGWQTQVGGRQPLDPSAEEVRVVAEFANTKLSDMSNTMFHKKLATVVTAERQVVSGMNYFITLELAATNCKKNEVERSDLANCVEKVSCSMNLPLPLRSNVLYIMNCAPRTCAYIVDVVVTALCFCFVIVKTRRT